MPLCADIHCAPKWEKKYLISSTNCHNNKYYNVNCEDAKQKSYFL